MQTADSALNEIATVIRVIYSGNFFNILLRTFNTFAMLDLYRLEDTTPFEHLY